MTRVALYASLVLGSGSLALGYALGGRIDVALLVLLLGGLWCFAQFRGWDWSAAPGLALAVFASATGLARELNFVCMFAGVLFPLFAWDLVGFRSRLRLASVASEILVMEKRHLTRLASLAVVGFVLVWLTMQVRWHFRFEVLVLLVLVAGLGLTQLVAWFRKS